MIKKKFFFLFLLCLSVISIEGVSNRPLVKLDIEVKSKNQSTTGTIICELFTKEAPTSVKNFLTYVEDGFYNGTIFHRLIKGFVIQGGGYEPKMIKKKL